MTDVQHRLWDKDLFIGLQAGTALNAKRTHALMANFAATGECIYCWRNCVPTAICRLRIYAEIAGIDPAGLSTHINTLSKARQDITLQHLLDCRKHCAAMA